MRSRPLLAALALAASLGCTARLEGSYPGGVASVPPAPGGLAVGATRVDLTPPPGITMGGFSRLGQRSRGFWLRIRARAVVLHAGESALAIVATDLWSSPDGLSDRVADVLAASHPEVPLRHAQLIVGASHSHHSPGNLSTDPFFGEMGQLEGGFHRAYFDWVAERIASAIARAWQQRVPARLAYEESVLDDVMRNRSLEPFLEDPEAAAILAENAGARCELGVHDDPRVCAAVDRRLRSLRAVDAASGRTRAVVGVLALHPTVMPPASAVYSGDVFGAAASEAERVLARREGGEPVVALLNGPEGDVSPTWSTRRDRTDVLRIAAQIEAKLLEPEASEPLAVPEIEIRRSRFELRSRCVAHEGEERCTAGSGYPGAPSAGGAEDGRNPVDWLLMFEGRRSLFPFGPQGAKAELVPFVTRGLTRLLPAPHEVELGIFSLGDTALVTLPGEFTTVAGQRMRAAVAATLPGLRRVVAAGLVGGFAYYTATPEEYDLQHYEGSSTLFGEQQATVLADGFAQLAATSPLAPGADARVRYEHRTATEIATDLSDVEEEACTVDGGVRHALGAEPVAFARFTDAALPAAGWAGRERLAPGFHAEQRSGPEAPWEPVLVDGLAENDDGPRLVATASPRADGAAWCVFWVLPPALQSGAELRLCMQSAADGDTRCADRLGLGRPGEAEGQLAEGS